MQKNTDYLKSLTIAGDTYIIRPVQEDDFDINLTHCKDIPDATESSVNIGIKPDTEKLNLFGIYDVDDVRSNAFVVAKVNGSEPQDHERIGFAMYARHRELYSYEFHMSVDRSLKDSTLPIHMFRMIVKHAMGHGVKVLFCHADENNTAMREIAERAHMLVTLESEKSHGVKYTLMLDKHPDILESMAS